MKAHVYIDTRGASKNISRNAPDGVRVAFHTSKGAIIELEANDDGTWHVHEGDTSRGDYTTVASGKHQRRL